MHVGLVWFVLGGVAHAACDDDGDGYEKIAFACSPGPFSADCDDTRASVNPNGTERPNDGLD